MLISKKWGLISIIGVIVFIGVVLGIYFGVSKSSSSTSQANELLLKTNEGAITIFDLRNKLLEKTLINEEIYGITAFDSLLDLTIYYGTTRANDPIRSTSSNYRNLSNITGTWTKSGLAIDDVNEKVYVVDRIAGNVYVADMQNDYTKTLITNKDQPQDIVLDPELGFMFVLGASTIIQAYMDGSKPKNIIEQENLRAFTIDSTNKVLYFTDGKIVGFYNYQQNTKGTPLKVENIISMTFKNDELYFIISTAHNTLNTTLISCNLKKLSCEGSCCELNFLYRNENLQEVKVYLRSSIKLENRCRLQNGKSNGGCEQLCLLTDTYSCACNDGWKLNSDLKTCIQE